MKKNLMKLFKIPKVEYIEVPYKDYGFPFTDILGGNVEFQIRRCELSERDNLNILISALISTGNKEEHNEWENKLENKGFRQAGSPYDKSVYFKTLNVTEFSELLGGLNDTKDEEGWKDNE